MQQTLKAVLSPLSGHLPTLLSLRAGTLPPEKAPVAVTRLGLSDENGLTKKGDKVLTHLLAIASLLDLHYA